MNLLMKFLMKNYKGWKELILRMNLILMKMIMKIKKIKKMKMNNNLLMKLKNLEIY